MSRGVMFNTKDLCLSSLQSAQSPRHLDECGVLLGNEYISSLSSKLQTKRCYLPPKHSIENGGVGRITVQKRNEGEITYCHYVSNPAPREFEGLPTLALGRLSWLATGQPDSALWEALLVYFSQEGFPLSIIPPGYNWAAWPSELTVVKVTTSLLEYYLFTPATDAIIPGSLLAQKHSG